MEALYISLFYISGFVIFWAMIGYPTSLKVIDKIYKGNTIEKDYSKQPTVTVMVVAHNEEKVIREKLENIIQLNYPKDKIEYLVASDNSTDKTNRIVNDFIKEKPNENIRLYEVKERKGKTNAQNEAHKTVNSEFLVMTDANSILDREAVKELVVAFSSNDIAYVSGRLSLLTSKTSDISNAETSYWDSDMKMREIEAKVQTITAGNGALYAVRTEEYYDFDPVESHDSAMPILFGLEGKRAITNNDAIAYEKTGEVVEDEFKRKVRMNRVLLRHIMPSPKILNVFKFKWFSYFYFGHRTCRYLLWAAHTILFIANALLIDTSWFYLILFLGQVLFYSLALLVSITRIKNKYLILIYYYCVTILAQWVGVYNIVTGKAKPFWEKAESTR